MDRVQNYTLVDPSPSLLIAVPRRDQPPPDRSSGAHRVLAAALARLGPIPEAKLATAQVLALVPISRPLDVCLHRGSRCIGVTLHQSLPRSGITVTTLAAIIELRRELITTPVRNGRSNSATGRPRGLERLGERGLLSPERNKLTRRIVGLPG